VPTLSRYDEILNSDAELYGGGNIGNLGGVDADLVPMHGHEQSIALTLPPLSTIIFQGGKPLSNQRTRRRKLDEPQRSDK
jgi:1,4-alpha-glucan branching enzyme